MKRLIVLALLLVAGLAFSQQPYRFSQATQADIINSIMTMGGEVDPCEVPEETMHFVCLDISMLNYTSDEAMAQAVSRLLWDWTVFREPEMIEGAHDTFLITVLVNPARNEGLTVTASRWYVTYAVASLR